MWTWKCKTSWRTFKVPLGTYLHELKKATQRLIQGM